MWVTWSRSVVSDSLWPYGLQPARLLSPWSYPGKNTGAGCHFLLQEDLPDPGFEPTSPASAGKFIATEPPGKCCRQKVQFAVLRREKFNRNFFHISAVVQIEAQMLFMLVGLVSTFMEVGVIIWGMLVRLKLFSLRTLVFWESLDTSNGSCFPL